MLRLREGIQADGDGGSHSGDSEADIDIGEANNGTVRTFPFDVRDLKILSLGNFLSTSGLLPYVKYMLFIWYLHDIRDR